LEQVFLSLDSEVIRSISLPDRLSGIHVQRAACPLLNIQTKSTTVQSMTQADGYARSGPPKPNHNPVPILSPFIIFPSRTGCPAYKKKAASQIEIPLL